MLKKLIAMTIVTTMLLSSFCIIAQAEYGYDYWEQIACKTYFSQSNNTTAKTTGDSVTAKNAYLRGSYVEQGAAKYYLYNDTTRMGDNNWIRLNQAYTYSGNMASLTEHMLCIDTTSDSFSGKSFYSKSTDMRGSLEIGTLAAFDKTKLSTTMTYQVDVKYTTRFANTFFVISTSTSGDRRINALKISDEGTLISGANSYVTEIGQLNLGQKYTIGIVIELVPTTTSGQYTVKKSIYLDQTKLETFSYSTAIPAIGTLCRFDIDFLPWTSESFSNFSSLGTDEYFYYYDASNCGKPTSNIRTKYTIIPTRIEFDNFYVYAGNKYATNKPSLNGKDTDFYITSNVIDNTNYVTVAAQTADDDETGTGTIVLATYNTSGALESIKTSPITLTKGAITEQDIDISTANANETKLFIINNTSAMTPLAQSTVLN